MFSAPEASPDASVRSTDLDALVSRSSAAALGYLVDPFAPLFLPPALRRSTERRPPLINIGTHARTWAIDQLVLQFLDGADEKQVVSLGAGTDTRFWRLRSLLEAAGKKSWTCRKWVEVDFEEATASKARTIVGKAQLKAALGTDVKVEFGGTGLSSSLYALLPGDLRSFSTIATLLEPLLQPSIPTLLLAECVLIYVPPSATSDILNWFSTTFENGTAVSYDPFGLQDSFGKVMIRNLATRNLSLPAADTTPTLASLSDRLTGCGFSNASSLSIKGIRQSVLPAEELSRVAKIEMIDEVEELNLVLDHYAITWGSFGPAPPEVGLVARQ